VKTELRREFLVGNEKVMTELKTIRQEQTANVGAHDRMQDTLDKHSVKIKNLELKCA